MSMLADEYALTHKKGKLGVGHASQSTHGPSPRNKFNFGGNPKKDRFRRLNVSPANVHNPQKTHGLPPRYRSSDREKKKMPTCYYYHKLGHLMADNWTQKNRRTKCINDRKCFLKNSLRPHREIIREEYRPFESDGYISPMGNPGREMLVKVLRDTGASQFLILENFMPQGFNSATGEYVVIHGMI